MRKSARKGMLTQCSTTGGTTGDPIEIWRNIQCSSVAEAAYWRGKAWRGIKPWHKGVLVYGFGKGSWYGRMRMRLTRKWGVEAFRTDDEGRMAARGLLSQVRPKYVEGFVTDLLRLGEKLRPEPGWVGCVITTGEMLYSGQRIQLEEYFHAPVFDYYGSNEVGSLAFECEDGAKHVTDEHVILETIDDNDQPVWNSPGRILVTDLDNYAMPLIRYELGDTGVLSDESCPCGRNLTVLKQLLGRTQEAIRNRAGESLSATYFAARFKELKNIRRFQLIQRTLEEIDLDYELARPGARQGLEEITAEIKARLGSEMIVQAHEVHELKVTTGGKCPLIIALRGDECGANAEE